MKESSKTLRLTEGAAMVALSTVLSFIVIYQLPWDGSITLLSMLPVCLYSIKHGVKYGLLAAFSYSLIQLIRGIGLGLFGWGLTPAALIGCILFDYILAYTALGLSGIFRSHGTWGRIGGVIFSLFLMFLLHFISGVVIFGSFGELWEGFSTDNTVIYSLLYNGSYMLPEIIFTAIGTFILLKIPQTRKILGV